MQGYLEMLQLILIIELILFAFAIIKTILNLSGAIKNLNKILNRKEAEIDNIVESVDKTLVSAKNISKQVDAMMPDVQGTVKSINVITEDVESVTTAGKNIANDASDISGRFKEDTEKVGEVFSKVSDLLGGKDE